MPKTNELGLAPEETIPEDAVYFRVRMKFLKWYILFYDKNLKELDRVYGPFPGHPEAYKAVEPIEVEDLDRSKIPLNV